MEGKVAWAHACDTACFLLNRPSPAEMIFSARTLQLITLSAVLLGCWLRLAWPLEIEYKADEKRMFNFSQSIGATEHWPMMGMASGAGGVPNPGLSVWVFAGLAKVTGATTPVSLARGVQGLNCLALIALAGFALRFVTDERRIWLWAVCLAALSPTAILVQRKIWAQSVLPLLCVGILSAWWQRRTFWGAALWSGLVLLAAQIHMTGFFLLLAVSFWTLVFWRDSMNWRGWALGVICGIIPALPWLHAVLLTPLAPNAHRPALHHFFGPDFWALWATDGLGLGLNYNLGGDLSGLLRRPLIGGHETWLVALAEIVLIAIATAFIGRAAMKVWRERNSWWTWLSEVSGAPSESRFLVRALIVAYGFMLSLPDIILSRHYLLITFPLAYVWFAALGVKGEGRWRGLSEKLLLATLVLNLFVNVQLFGFLRENGGATGGDFGVSWRAQVDRGVSAP
jgi:hypothetical protein